MRGKPCCDGSRVFSCALTVGLLFAVLTGYQAGQSLDGDGTGTSVKAQFSFAPAPAIFGFLVGALAGALAGWLWTRPGVIGLVGMAFVAIVGGLVGMAVAGLVGSESRTVITGTAVNMEYGAPPGVLAAGAAEGADVGMLIAWRFRTRP